MEAHEMQKDLPDRIKRYLKDKLDLRQLTGDGLAILKRDEAQLGHDRILQRH